MPHLGTFAGERQSRAMLDALPGSAARDFCGLTAVILSCAGMMAIIAAGLAVLS